MEAVRIFIENVAADKLRERLNDFRPNEIISVVVSRYQDGFALFYQIIYKSSR
jgi:hypothetical protein